MFGAAAREVVRRFGREAVMAMWDRLIVEATSGRVLATLRQPLSESRRP